MIAILQNIDNYTLYRILYVVHIIAIVGAFGPLFLYSRLQRAGETQAMASMHMKLAFPSMILLWVAGMGMAGVGKISLGGTHWVSATIGLWVVSMAVSWFMIKPSISDTSEGARKKLAAGVGITHLVFVISLILMIFKPFVDSTYVFNT